MLWQIYKGDSMNHAMIFILLLIFTVACTHKNQYQQENLADPYDLSLSEQEQSLAQQQAEQQALQASRAPVDNASRQLKPVR